ncbi:hypothetical protein BEL04_21785 [Mucilaginibacter sp. PPCGB 2223]|uniref:hypothetical protein n=1 Tax=Mucilaginibacter sp. PPCGB 2223 TaxID=1886027 RepID=UPI00082528DD|nr:hypothetical protein [Mucilaginibacter sp. PPCGB 2223]OCX50417.1 hypothetical protein BEL04_21785 [Mucilaginibacter sp. PPCGB 2223]
MPGEGDLNKMIELLKQKELACRIEKEAYQRWVDLITLIRFSMIGGAALLIGTALFNILMRPLDYLTTQNTIIAVSCSFLAVLLAGLHIALEMDEIHLESRRLQHEYELLEVKCAGAQNLKYNEMRDVYFSAQQKQLLLKSEAQTKPPKWIRQQVQLIERKFF